MLAFDLGEIVDEYVNAYPDLGMPTAMQAGVESFGACLMRFLVTPGGVEARGTTVGARQGRLARAGAKRPRCLHKPHYRPIAILRDGQLHFFAAHIDTYEELPEYYLDRPFVCRACGKAEIWRAADQKSYYVQAKGHVDAFAVECHECCKSRERGGGERKLITGGCAATPRSEDARQTS